MQLRKAGTQATKRQADIQNEEQTELTEAELFKASDEAIDLMKEAISDEETFKKVSSPVKDSSDKLNVIRAIKALWFKMSGS